MYTTEESDEALAGLSLKDKHVFAYLVERYERPLSVYIRRLGVSLEADIEDVLQETFLKAYINLNSFDPKYSFSSWIYRIAHNEAMTFFRKRKVRPHGSLIEDSEGVLQTLASELDIIADLTEEENRVVMRSAITSLPREYQEVLILKFYEHKSYDEISDILSIPPGTVGTRMHRAKKSLAQALEHNHYHHGT